MLLFVIFLLLVTLNDYFLLCRRARVYIVLIVRRGKGAPWHFFLIFFYSWGGGGWRLMLFFSFHWKCGRRRGEMGTFFPFLKNIFVLFRWMTWWMTRQMDGWKASFRPRRPWLYKNIRSPFLYVFLLSFCFAFLFFLFFCFSFISFFQIGFLNNN